MHASVSAGIETMKSQVLIGTSGWMYDHWRERFYPEKLAKTRWLEFFTDYFPTAEVNYSFYKLPDIETYEKWRRQVPRDFVFALKASRLITHAKRLNAVEDLWDRFVEHARHLGPNLGPILFQFPERF